MVAILTSNILQGRDNRAPAPAVKEDGSGYRWRMFFDNNQRIVDADELSELLDVLIEDYSLFDDDLKKQTRVALARQIQLAARTTLLANLPESLTSGLKDWEWEVLAYGDDTGTDPYGWGDGSGTLGEVSEDSTDIWSAKVPLVLIESSYAPFTEIPAPISSEGDYREVKNIIWIRPEREIDFLSSLSRIGYISFGAPQATNIGE